jgi:predicted phosphate transport protein (TIGR00153 family)
LTSRLFRYLKKRRRSMVIQYIQDHMHQVSDVVRAVNECLSAWCDDDAARTQELATVVFQEENVADDLRREVAERARSPDLSTQAREDLVRLSRRVDFIANFCKAACRNIHLLANQEVPNSLRQSAHKISIILLKQVKLLEEVIDSLGVSSTSEDVEAANQAITEISQFEHEIDELYFQAKAQCLLLSEECSAAVLIIASDMLRNLENASDFTDGTAELVGTLLITDS